MFYGHFLTLQAPMPQWPVPLQLPELYMVYGASQIFDTVEDGLHFGFKIK